MPNKDWPGWDEDEPLPPRGKHEGTAAFDVLDLPEEEPGPPEKKGQAPAGWDAPGGRPKKGQLPDGWETQPAAAAATGSGAGGEEGAEEEAEDEATLAARAAEAEANQQALAQLIAETDPAFAPLDLAAIIASITVLSPTRLLLGLPATGEPVPETVQQRLQVHHREAQWTREGVDPDEAGARARSLLDGPWVRVRLTEEQVQLTQEICGRPIRELVFLDPRRDIDRSMHAYTLEETTEMAEEVARLFAHYDAACELEQGQLFQLELDARVEQELAAKQEGQAAAMQAMMPQLVVDPKTAKKNARAWAKMQERMLEEG